MIVLATIIAYSLILMVLGRMTGGRGNDEFFRGGRRSKWQLVAFGMIGASLSGVTFVSVPGMVVTSGMTYMQMCLGFILGYVVVAMVLMPLFYRYGLTSIYGWLGKRFGNEAQLTGAGFFMLSKLTGASARLFLACAVLHDCVLAELHVPFFVTVMGTLALMWLYTRRSGVRTLVWTDAFQTLCLMVALLMVLTGVVNRLGIGWGDAFEAVMSDERSRMFVFDDWKSTQYFWKQFLSGAFVVVAMTGLDQDMMQKNLTCKSLKDAQKSLCSYGLMFAPVNFLFMSLGLLLVMLYDKIGMPLPADPDSILPLMVAEGHLGEWVMVFFALGIVSSAFSSADSAMTALTTSICVDIIKVENSGNRLFNDRERVRKVVHMCVAIAFVILILMYKGIGNGSVIDLIYRLASYTYGPLLGLFAFGWATRRMPCGRMVPVVAVMSPVVCLVMDYLTKCFWGYAFGYELLMFNAFFTFVALWMISKNTKNGRSVSAW